MYKNIYESKKKTENEGKNKNNSEINHILPAKTKPQLKLKIYQKK